MEDKSKISHNNGAVANAYEATIKQLVFILKSKTSDNLKQLEELWDSINSKPLANNSGLAKLAKNRVSPTPRSSSQSPITSISENSNDSTSSTGSGIKRDYAKVYQSGGAMRQMKKSKTEFTKPEVKHIHKSKGAANIDMLDDFTCVLCKNFNQELNNKLVECRKCMFLYHQQCHKPKIRDEEIDDKDFEECTACKTAALLEDNEVQSITQQKQIPSSSLYSKLIKSNTINDTSNDSILESKEKVYSYKNGTRTKDIIEQTSRRSSVSPILFETYSEVLYNLPNSNNNLGKTKGLASLATKFGNGSEKRPLTPNQTDELFDKYKTNNQQTKPDSTKDTFKKPSSTPPSGPIKLKSSPLPLNPLPKKNSPFNLYNGVNQKHGVSSFKDKKTLSNGSGLNKLEMSRSKIS